MPLYRYARDNLLENAWGDNPRAYPERFTIVRETTSLGGERAQQAAYSLPSQRFSLALSFPHSPLSLGKRPLVCVLRISCARLVHFRSAEHRGNVQSMTVPQGGWGRRKVGDWGRKPRRGRGISMQMRPPSPGLSPQASVNPHCVKTARRLYRTHKNSPATPETPKSLTLSLFRAIIKTVCTDAKKQKEPQLCRAAGTAGYAPY